MKCSSIWANNRIRLAVTDGCNIACSYCHNEGQTKGNNYLSHDLFNCVLRVIKHSPRLLDTITFTGGEPLLHKSLEYFAAACRPYARRLTLVTNGLILDRSRILALRQAGIDKIRIGVDSLQKANSRPTRGLAPSETVAQVIEMLRADCMRFELNIVLTQYNKDELAYLIDYCQRNHISVKFFEHVSVGRDLLSGHMVMDGRPFVDYEQFVDIVRSVLGEINFAECPEYGAANHVYQGDGFTIRYCRFLCPYNLCYKTGTRISLKGYIYSCMGAYGLNQIYPGQGLEEMTDIIRSAATSDCSHSMQLIH